MALRLIAQALRQGGALAHADVRQQATRHLHWRPLARLARFCVALEVVALTATVMKQPWSAAS